MLGNIPLARKLTPPHEKYELGFRWLPEGNLRLTSPVEPDRMFADYTYRSSLQSAEHIQKRIRYASEAYESRLAQDAELYPDIPLHAAINETQPPQSISEIACNDGYMLNHYASSGKHTLIVGVEPAKNLHSYIHNDITVYGKFFDIEVGKAIRTLHGSFDIIHAHHVVAHTPAPANFLQGIRAMMNADSVAIVEFQYLVDLLTETQFYHFYHEHCHYLSLTGFAHYAQKAGLELVRVNRVTTHGGSLICALITANDAEDGRQAAMQQQADNIRNILEYETLYFSQPNLFARFMKRTERKLRNLVKYVNGQPPGTLNGLYASAKATVILNLAVERGLELDRFNCFYDDTAENWGHCVPGTQIEIKAMHPIEKASGRAILFAPNLEAHARGKLPDMEIINIEGIFNGQ